MLLLGNELFWGDESNSALCWAASHHLLVDHFPTTAWPIECSSHIIQHEYKASRNKTLLQSA